MNPDVEWEQYKSKGNMSHDRMSPETREAIKEIRIEFEKAINELKVDHLSPIREDIKSVKAELKNKVSFKIFTFVLSILMGIVVGWMGVVWITLQQLSEKTSTVNNNVGLIQWRLDNFEIVK